MFKCLLLFAMLLYSASTAIGQPPPPNARFSNPIISGLASDPSIVRVDRDFYLVNSSFEYFPGIPVYHSQDLVNWKLISYAIHRKSQADLFDAKASEGIRAPTIRFNNGRFYVITTNTIAGKNTNFIVTASDARGPWSGPIVVKGAPGRSPSLFFDDDGRVWYAASDSPKKPDFEEQSVIWIQELDKNTLQLKGDRKRLWGGCCNGISAENPHLYKRNGLYYLLISEGGPGYENATSIAVSKNIEGPYQSNPRNPVLTHRQLSYDFPITGVGHGDLVELADGRWYALAAGWRKIDGKHGILGRETFLAPVRWETDSDPNNSERISWPVISPLTGKLELTYPLPFPRGQQKRLPFRDEFRQPVPGLEWNFRRSPKNLGVAIVDEKLVLPIGVNAIEDSKRYSFAGIRQRDFEFEVTTSLDFTPANQNEEAGVAVIQNERGAFTFTRKGSQLVISKWTNGKRTNIAKQTFRGNKVYLKIRGNYLKYEFDFSPEGKLWDTMSVAANGLVLSPTVMPGLNNTGVFLGVYASSNGEASNQSALYDWFEYKPTSGNRDAWFEKQFSRMLPVRP